MNRFRRGDLTFDVRDAGPQDGEPVVLLHGFPQDSSCWDGVAPRLHGAGLRTLAPDQRGYSPGARPRGRKAYTIAECSADVIAMLDEAGLDRAHVVGHDWGGAVAWNLGGRHADRVQTLTVLSTPHPAAMVRAFLGTQVLRSWYMLAFQLPLLPELALGRVDQTRQALERSGLPTEIAERYARRLAEPGAAGPPVGWYRAIPWSLRAPSGVSKVPTTYVWGNKDFALGRTAGEATAKFVEGPYRFVELPAGHWLPERRAAEVAEAVVSRVRGGTAA